MKILSKAILFFSLLAVAPLGFACDYPSRIDMPNGLSASKEEMLAGQKNVKQFVANMKEYLDCIVAEEKASRSDLDNLPAEDEQLREDILNKKYNAGVDDMERIAAAFNDAVQYYRNRDN